ncbi:MAG TPA: TetR/AcrR family transcriptional regulator [Syntrophomonadaceae bacterium]|nr:TetR/AcrR family transcriptional regulator [Syntrophomonadaceae bacterium]
MEAKKVSRTERRKEETRKRIMTVAIDLFKQQGFDETTVDQIANAADVAKCTIYNHFSEKEAIIYEHIQSVIREQTPAMLEYLDKLPDTRTRLIAALQKTMEWMHIDLNNDLFERHFIYKISQMMRAFKHLDMNASTGFSTVMGHILKLGLESGEIRPDMSFGAIGGLEFSHFLSALLWVNHPELISINESIEQNVDCFLNGVINKPRDS